jgi:MFS family permease
MAVDNRARLAFAFSGAAQGLISNGILYFLLIYYSQVLGLDASLAGLALMIAMIFDAVSDPLVGRWSDRLRHRSGRRHPFLYFSIVPVTLTYYLLWDVPELSQTGLFFYLLAMIITLRVCLTAHVVPFSALTPELAPDYGPLRGEIVGSVYLREDVLEEGRVWKYFGSSYARLGIRPYTYCIRPDTNGDLIEVIAVLNAISARHTGVTHDGITPAMDR